MVEDSVDDTLLIAAELRRGGLDPVFERVETAAGMQAALEVHNWDLIICDYSMPHFDGPAALASIEGVGVGYPFHQRVRHSGRGNRRGDDEGRRGARLCHERQPGPNGAGGKRELRAAQERRDRRHAESASAYLASIVESCDDAIIGKTLDGTVLSWNPGAERIYGYSAAEMIGRSISSSSPPIGPKSCRRSSRPSGRQSGGRFGNGAHSEGRNAVRFRSPSHRSRMPAAEWWGFDGGARHCAPQAGGE